MTTKRMRFGAAGIGLFLFASVALAGTQAPEQNKAEKSESATASTQDHAAAYYHYMLAQRYKDLAGIYNRSA